MINKEMKELPLTWTNEQKVYVTLTCRTGRTNAYNVPFLDTFENRFSRRVIFVS